MSGKSCRRGCEEYDFSERGMKISGKKWEYPIPKSKEYWKRFCDDEERRLIVVRNPYLQLSYNSIPQIDSKTVHFNSPVIDQTPNQNSFSNSRVDVRRSSDNSLHKLRAVKSKPNSSKAGRGDMESFPKPILNAPFVGAPKIRDTTCNLATSSKTVRILEFDTIAPQPSSAKILPDKVDRIHAPFSVQNEPTVQGESSSTLPILATLPEMPDPQLTLKKLRKHLRLPEKNNFKIKDEGKNRKSTVDRCTIPRTSKKGKKTSTDADSLMYSARFAYGALRKFTKNKNLDFKLEIDDDHLQSKPVSKSDTDSLSKDDEKEDSSKAANLEEEKRNGDCLLEINNFKIKDEVRNKKSTKDPRTIPQASKKDEKASTDEDSLMYSARFAYKALRKFTKNKNLDFKLRIGDHLQTKSLPKSGSDSLSCDDENEDSSKASFAIVVDELKQNGDSLKSVKDLESARLKSDEARTILTESRSTSGTSPTFVYPEKWENPSSRILSSIPELSGFPRKNRDRCLPCMYKPFETPTERKVSLPRTALQRIIHPESVALSSFNSSKCSDSTSASIRNFNDEIERILNCEVETSDVASVEESNACESEVVTRAASSFEEKHEPGGTAEQKSISESESHKAITKKVKGDQREDDTTSTNFNDPAATSTQPAPVERAKVASSFHSESSDEDDSIVVSMSDDQPKPKYWVPCHAPTIFKPSLEPLRALRNRKPTTLQDRIAMLESVTLKKGASSNDYDHTAEKSKFIAREVAVKDKIGKEGKTPPPLTKAKSVLGKMMVQKAEADNGKQPRVLRKGISLSSFPVPTDIASNKSEIYSEASENALGKLDATSGDDNLKTPIKFLGGQRKVPLRNPEEVMEILEGFAQNASSTDILDTLCKEFSERLANNTEKDDWSIKESKKMSATLTRLLVDSKRYLDPDKFPSDLLFSSNQPPPCNFRLLRQIFPRKTYNLVAPLLGMPELHEKIKTGYSNVTDERDLIYQTRGTDETLSTNDSLEVHPPTSRDTESASDEEKVGHRRYNPYALFLMKPRRKVVTWRRLTKRDLEGYDPDATLKMRADNLMKKICQDFCQWVESLGGTDNTIDEEVLRDMFEIDFSAEACRAMQVSIQEMPVVPAEVALTRNCPGASKLNMTKRHVMQDAKAEETPAKVKAFGTAIPWKLRFVPPDNQVRKKWLQCDNVPKDLETMEMVWKGITHLKSVRGFVEWLQQHPEVPQPYALKKIASLDIRTLRQIEDDETFAHLELDINQIKSLRVAVNGDDVVV